MQPNLSILSFSLLLLLLLVTGCVPSPDVREESSQPDTDPLLEQAASLEAIGDYISAAELLEQIAPGKESPAREKLLLRAAENRFRAADTEAAIALLARIDASNLPAIDFQKRLLVAEMAIARNRPEEALSLLSEAPPANVRVDLRRRYHKDRAEGFRLSGNLLESGQELVELDLLLEGQPQRLDNQLTIIQTYAVLTDGALELLQPSPPGLRGGWMQLTLIIKNQGNDPQAIKPLLSDWREQFPEHPALPELLDGYYQNLKAQYLRPDHLAVMLPESGPYAKVAAALRDGMLAAYYEHDPKLRPQLVFYDSSSPDDTWPLYQEALDTGADMVVGPLNKQGVSQFAQAGELEIPVLALNQVALEMVPPDDLYQYALSPEDEARQVAERALIDGFSSALVLTPTGSWGDRIFTAFRDRWEQLGGNLAEHQRYDTKANDFSAPIQALLNLDESQARKKDILRLMGKKVEFQPRRRRDADFIFLAAKVQKAREIRPQLQFHHAAGMPIYTTSHAFSGEISPDKDQDLNGIRFPVMPWLLLDEGDDPLSMRRLSGIFSDIRPRYLPLYAMGIDSYHLLNHLARLQNNPREMLEGKSGNLYLDQSNVVHRQLLWAEMKKGIPTVIGFAPRMDLDDYEFPETAGEELPVMPAAATDDPLPDAERDSPRTE